MIWKQYLFTGTCTGKSYLQERSKNPCKSLGPNLGWHRVSHPGKRVCLGSVASQETVLGEIADSSNFPLPATSPRLFPGMPHFLNALCSQENSLDITTVSHDSGKIFCSVFCLPKNEVCVLFGGVLHVRKYGMCWFATFRKSNLPPPQFLWTETQSSIWSHQKINPFTYLAQRI